jgi:hypothetical protein
MEQHPVPQDIKSFEFKLVGDMTLKQFGYLAAGAIVAFLIYSSNWYPIVKFPMVIITFAIGVSLAFVPIQERPLETWITNFFLAIYRPTLFHWQKSTGQPLQGILAHLSDQIEIVPLPPAPTDESNQQATEAIPQAEQKQQLETYLETVASPTTIDDLLRLREKVNPTPAPTPPPPEFPPPLPPVSPSLMTRPVTIHDLETRRIIDAPGPKSAINRTMEIDPQNLTFPPLRESPYLKDHVKVIKKSDLVSKPQTLQITTANLIAGTIRDNTGVIIPGTIVIIKNAEGISVRALRTNKVGQFVASTPLESGVYFLEMEKEGYQFDTLQIKLDGTIIPPLEITAK